MRVSFPVEVLHAIRVPTWHALFASRGYPPGVTPRTSSLAAIGAALATADLPAPLARALFTVLAFATEAGRADLYAVADALSYPPGSPAASAPRWPEASSPADLIASLLAASSTDPAIAELLSAAQILRNRSFRPRPSHIYIGSGAPDLAPSIGEPTQYAEPLRACFTAWAARHDFGAVLPVLARAVAGVFHSEIVHEDRPDTHVGSTDAAPSTRRPLRSHHLTYEPAPTARRLTITTDCLEAVTPLARIAGLVFFSDARHFLDFPAVDLWRLQEHGPASLSVPEMSLKLRVQAIGGTWHSGKSHAITPRGRDFFKALARYKIRIEGGRLDLVTLRASLPPSDGGPATCDAVLRPPHHLTVSEPEAAPLFCEFLDRAKITSPEAPLRDFFSFQPWIDSSDPWIVAEGERVRNPRDLVRSSRAVGPRAERDGRFVTTWRPY